MTDVPSEARTAFLSTLPAGRAQLVFAGAVIVVSTGMFLALAPFAKMPLRPLPAFIPIYQSALVFNDIMTVVFLLGQRQFAQLRGLSLLASAYLFTALMSVVHALTFPGLFAPAGLLGGNSQTTAWLYMFWHSGFPLFIIAYALHSNEEAPLRHRSTALIMGAGLVLACGSTLLAIYGQGLLPAIMQGNRETDVTRLIVTSVWTLNLVALIFMLRRRPYCVLDLWLIVTMSAWLFDIALSALFNAGRYDLGFYAGRIYGLLAASFVLIVLLFQNGKLYMHLIKLRESDRAKAAELRRLSTQDPLTGIANRRAFEDALDQEWRRVMRHRTALSLLMIDVDYFKRFNDGYGHVAGDQCLRLVAQTVAAKARRAGELAARYGGEEFAVLLPHSDLDAARQLGEIICQAVRDTCILHSGSDAAPYVTISVGAASIDQIPDALGALCREGETGAGIPSGGRAGGQVLIETADQALYAAKLAGRNRVSAAGADEGAAAVDAVRVQPSRRASDRIKSART